MLLRFDPFRELDRRADEAVRSMTRITRPLPLDARRFEDRVELRFDVPGVATDAIDLSVERDVLTLTVERPAHEDGETIANERPVGRFTRQLTLGDHLDADGLTAEHADGVLVVSIPLAAKSVSRRVEIGGSDSPEAIDTTASDTTAA